MMAIRWCAGCEGEIRSEAKMQTPPSPRGSLTNGRRGLASAILPSTAVDCAATPPIRSRQRTVQTSVAGAIPSSPAVVLRSGLAYPLSSAYASTTWTTYPTRSRSRGIVDHRHQLDMQKGMSEAMSSEEGNGNGRVRTYLGRTRAVDGEGD
ncbi:hypothetical protein BJ912DRAFT_995739, partial [Pholiota molesta]